MKTKNQLIKIFILTRNYLHYLLVLQESHKIFRRFEVERVLIEIIPTYRAYSRSFKVKNYEEGHLMAN